MSISKCKKIWGICSEFGPRNWILNLPVRVNRIVNDNIRTVCMFWGNWTYVRRWRCRGALCTWWIVLLFQLGFIANGKNQGCIILCTISTTAWTRIPVFGLVTTNARRRSLFSTGWLRYCSTMSGIVNGRIRVYTFILFVMFPMTIVWFFLPSKQCLLRQIPIFF